MADVTLSSRSAEANPQTALIGVQQAGGGPWTSTSLSGLLGAMTAAQGATTVSKLRAALDADEGTSQADFSAMTQIGIDDGATDFSSMPWANADNLFGKMVGAHDNGISPIGDTMRTEFARLVQLYETGGGGGTVSGSGVYFSTISAMAAASGLTAGDYVEVTGALNNDDGYGGTYKILSTGTADGWMVVNLPSSGNLKAHKVTKGRTSFYANEFGWAMGRTGVQNAAAIERLWDWLNAMDDGGEGIVPGGSYVCGPVVFAQSTPNSISNIEIRGEGRPLITAVNVNGAAGEFMWDFRNGGGNGTTGLALSNFVFEGDKDPSVDSSTNGTQMNLVRIEKTNRLFIKDCFARHCRGTTLLVQGPNNARIDWTSFNSGTDTLYSQYLVGLVVAGTNNDEKPNDVELSGASERDFNGINIANAPLIRTTHRLKIHGRPNGKNFRGFSMHSCNACDIQLLLTLGWEHPGFVYFADATALNSGNAVETFHYPINDGGTGFNLDAAALTVDIDAIYNLTRVTQGSDTAGLILIECASSNTYLKLKSDQYPRAGNGEVVEFYNGSNNTGADFVYIDITDPTTLGAGGVNVPHIDLSEFRMRNNTGSGRRLRKPAALNVGAFTVLPT